MFQLIQACARPSADVEDSRLVVHRPMLPPFLTYLKFFNLERPFGHVDRLIERRLDDVMVTILRKTGTVQLKVTKEAEGNL